MADDKGRKGVRESGGDAVQLTIDYVKQETLGPLKGMGSYLKFGITGATCLALGSLLLLLGVLRLLQSETGLTGNLSWVPYLIVIVLAGALIGLALWRTISGPAARKLPPGGQSPGGNP